MLSRWIHVQKIQYSSLGLHQILSHPLKVPTMQGGYRLKVKSKYPNSKVTVRRGKSLVSGAGKFAHSTVLAPCLEGAWGLSLSHRRHKPMRSRQRDNTKGTGTVPHLRLSNLSISLDLGNHGVASHQSQN